MECTKVITLERIPTINDGNPTTWNIRATMSDGSRTFLGWRMTERGSKSALTRYAKKFRLKKNGNTAQ